MQDGRARHTFNKRALTISEAAKYACVSRTTIDNWLSRGILAYEELPGGGSGAYRFRRIRLTDLDAFLDGSRREPAAPGHREGSTRIVLLPPKSPDKAFGERFRVTE